ncbi:MAG: hypothetical protein ACOYXM_03690 [Actinomycetota bacterium]
MKTWHATTDSLVQFARSPEALDDVTASSIEQHLTSCAECRAAVTAAAGPGALERSWAAVADLVDRPHRTYSERVLVRLGLPIDMARVVGATPALRTAWLATTVLLAVAATAVARDAGSDAPFLVVAPVVPLGSVFLAFLPAEEPAGEAAAATPLFGAGLVLRRAAAVLVPTFAVLLAAGLAQRGATAGAAWILPGLALTFGSLALATYMRAAVAAGTLAMSWLTLLTLVSVFDGQQLPVARTAVFQPLGQACALGLSLLAAAALYTRRDRFATIEATW